MADDIPVHLDLAEPPMELDAMARLAIGAAIEVHRELGPGFPEEVYQRAMEVELRLRGIPFEAQRPVTVTYKGEVVGSGKVDLLICGRLIVELKAVSALLPLHRLQTRSYLHTLHEPLGLLINFDVPLLKEGIRRVIETES